jgi:hypothetical protein
VFESFGDILSGVVAVVAVSYLVFSIEAKRKKLRELFNVMDGDDAEMFVYLEDMVSSGKLTPHHRIATA